jgi:hypothetical protein
VIRYGDDGMKMAEKRGVKGIGMGGIDEVLVVDGAGGSRGFGNGGERPSWWVHTAPC